MSDLCGFLRSVFGVDSGQWRGRAARPVKGRIRNFLFVLVTTAAAAPANADNSTGHGTTAYHFHHSSGGTYECSYVQECRDLQIYLLTQVPTSAGGNVQCPNGAHSNNPTGPWQLYGNSWTIRTFAQCLLNGEPVGTNFGFDFTWWLNGTPPECGGVGSPPHCPPEPGFTLEDAPSDCVGSMANETNPCNPADGSKTQVEVDYDPPTVGSPSFTRFYSSRGPYKSDRTLAPGWRHTYSRAINEEPDWRSTVRTSVAPSGQSSFYTTAADACTNGWDDIKTVALSGDFPSATAAHIGGNDCKITSGGSTVAILSVRSVTSWSGWSPPATIKTITRPNGSYLKFELISGNWVNELNSSVSLTQSGTDWVFTNSDDTVETYNADGQLISIATRSGLTETLEYNLTAAQGGDDDDATLDRVTGEFGHELTFAYDANAHLSTVTTPDGTITFAYNGNDTLASVTYPDTSDREYLYEEVFISGLPDHLVGIVDENGDEYASWKYDMAGRAIRSEHAGGQERVDITYGPADTTTLDMANGAQRVYSFTTRQGRRALDSLSGDVCSTCPGGDIQSRTYDSNGFLYEATDWEGTVTRTARNAEGLVTTLTEAVGTSDQRITTTAWHSTYRLPTQITSPTNTTTFTHDGDGNVLTVTVSGGGLTRASSFTYDANGQVLTVNGPRTDLNDTTTFEYYSCATGSECGQLKKVTNALGQVTDYDSYDAAGRLTQWTDPNGLQTSYTYDSRGRVLTVTETPTSGTARTTTMTYDSVGQLLTQTNPDGSMLTYAYDAAHDLTSVTDNLGNSVTYTYDVMGNVIGEDYKDPLSALTRTMSYARELNYRLDTATDGPITSDLNYDLVGNLTSEADANGNTTQFTYDALHRLKSTLDALSGTSSITYDSQDRVTEVEAANGATTDFVYDALGNLTSETSPDRGLLTYTYDDAGNRLTATDARGITATYTYDALNRPLTVTYPTVAENVSYSYDNVAAEGVGRLTSITDQAGTITYTYNEFGDVISDSRVINGQTYATSYDYDASGQVTSITYPSGRIVDYVRDSLGQITQVTSTESSIVKNIVTAASYEPFGPVASMTYGNGLVFDYSRRTNYQVDDISSSGVTGRTYGFDAAGNVVSLADSQSDYSVAYTYDALNRVDTDISFQIRSYPADVTAQNPILYWRFEETSGTVAADSSGNGNTGTYSGTINLGEPAVAPGVHNSMEIPTSGSGYVQGPKLNGVTITGMEAWVHFPSLGAGQEILTLFNGPHDRIILSHRSHGRIDIWKNSTGIELETDTTISSGVPHHVAVWYDSQTNLTYLAIDGAIQTDTYTGNLLAVTNPEVIMAGWKYNGPVSKRSYGWFDEIALYTGSVSASTFFPTIDHSFTYDANGNRTSVDDGSATTNYSYQTLSNELTAIGASSITRDLAGNRTADQGGNRTFAYNNAGRLSEVSVSSSMVADYVYNSLGQRTRKNTTSDNIVYLYDLSGNLIAEHDQTGTHIRDYVWMNDMPVAQIEAGETFRYIHGDHLNTPRLATNDSQTVVWRWDSDAFGTTAANDDPDGDSTATEINLRFPGQYFDAETGLHYNYFRTYDPSTGRYLESDPIGLDGGLNTFGYVAGNPVSSTDSSGQYIDSVRATCVQDPVLCMELMGVDVAGIAADLQCAISEIDSDILQYAAAGAVAVAATAYGANKLRRGRNPAKGASQEVPQLVYRGGSATPANMTPRPDLDLDGLSTFDSLEAAVRPGGKAQVIDTTKLRSLCATCTPPPPGHVSISAGDAAANASWAATRGSESIHPATKEVMDAIVDTVRRPK